MVPKSAMDADAIIALIEKRRDEYRDRQLGAGPGVDAIVVEGALRAWEFAEEYDLLLAEIKAHIS